MSSALWLSVPVTSIRICELTATQPGIYFSPLIRPTDPVGADPYPHVICWRGAHYLEDGHHRTVRAVLNGQEFIEVRQLFVLDTLTITL